MDNLTPNRINNDTSSSSLGEIKMHGIINFLASDIAVYDEGSGLLTLVLIIFTIIAGASLNAQNEKKKK